MPKPKSLRDYIQESIKPLPGHNFWTPARMVGASMVAAGPTAAPGALLAATHMRMRPREMKHLPIPKEDQPHDEASAARYGARWEREHRADVARDVSDQVKAGNERREAERDLAIEQGKSRDLHSSVETGRDATEHLEKSAAEYREFLRKGK